MDKASETAKPGYYSVRLDSDDILVEIAALPHSAVYRFTFNRGGPARLVFDLDHGCANPIGTLEKLFEWGDRRVLETKFERQSATRIAAYRSTFSWCDCRSFLAGEFSRTIRGQRVLRGKKPDHGEVLALDFGELPAGGELEFRLGLSSLGAAEAAANLDAEAARRGFAEIAAESSALWKDALSRIALDPGTDSAVARNFSAATYHVCCQPNDIGAVGAPFYSTFSLWDTFRAAHPLYTLIAPERVGGFVDSLLKTYLRNGYLPIWGLGGTDNHCMIGHHAVPVIVDALLKGFDGFDRELAWEAVTNSLTVSHRAANGGTWGLVKEDWTVRAKYGYYPFDAFEESFEGKKITGESVSRLMECCYDDACAARMARATGRSAEAERFERRAGDWTNVFDRTTGLVRGRDAKGDWREPFDPYRVDFCWFDEAGDYTEGNAWQYTWHVLHDPQRLVALMGGPEKAGERLDALFADRSKGGEWAQTIDGWIGQYAHGNEPSHHIAYLYAFTDRPWRTAEIVREVFDRFYSPTPSGLVGNEDCGQMSAWYVFSALGFYPVDPCGGDYVLGAPQVPGAEIRLPGGRRFRIKAVNFSKENRFVRAVRLNGSPLDGRILRHSDVVAGGELVFEMSDRPATEKPPVSAATLEIANRAVTGDVTVVSVPWAFKDGKIDWLFNPTKLKGPVNHEWVWQLNRMYFWTAMGEAYRATGDEKYAKAFAAQLAGWLDQTGGVPSEKDYNGPDSPWRTIEEGLRLMSFWPSAWDAFKDSPAFTDALKKRFFASMHAQAKHLLKHRTDHNWLLMEMNGVYTFAAKFPDFPEAAAWRRESAQVFSDALRAQVLPDGLHDELSPDYHSVALWCAMPLYRIAKENGFEKELPADYLDTLRLLAEGPIALTTPAFTQPRFNDCYTMHLPAVLHGVDKIFPERRDFLWAATEGREGEPPSGATASRFLPWGGFAAMRSDWSREATYLCFDVGPLGICHEHQDKLSFTLWKGGEELVFDDGGGQYEESSERWYALSGYDHNTLLVDGLAQQRGAPRRMSEPIDAGWESTAERDRAVGFYDQGFGDDQKRLVKHRREIVFDKEKDVFTITDDVESVDGAAHVYEILFQLPTAMTEISQDGTRLIARYGREWNLELSVQEGGKLSAVSGQREPRLSGWFIGRNDLTNHPATTVTVSATSARKNHRFVTTLRPVKNTMK